MSNPDYKIEFANQQHQPFERTPLSNAVAQILADHGVVHSEISIALVDDPTIRRLNQQYLNHDFETDVISFVLSEDPKTHSLCGQLIVSTDTASTLAQELGATFQDELLLYVIHGMLHLVGYDDNNPDAASEMRALEKKYLANQSVEYRGSNPEVG